MRRNSGVDEILERARRRLASFGNQLRGENKSFKDWELWWRMNEPSIAQRYMSDSQDPMTARQYADYWRRFADSWSPGGSAPRIPGSSGYGFVPDKPLGTYNAPPAPDYASRAQGLADSYGWLSPGAIREMAANEDMSEDDIIYMLLRAMQGGRYRR